MEEFIKIKTDEFINKIKRDCIEQGVYMPENYEKYIRAGISYGLCLSSMALAKLPSDITF